MNPTSTEGNSTEQPPLPILSSQSPSYTFSLQQQQQQQQALVLQWLEEQQQPQEQQRRHSLNQAILVATAAQQQDTQQPQNVLSLPSMGNTVSPVLLETELRNEIILQQQRRMQITHDNLHLDNNKSLIQESLFQLLSTNVITGQERNGSSPFATCGGGSINIAGASDVDHNITAADILLQRNRLQDAIRMLQIQGVLHADNSTSRVVNSNHDGNAFTTTARLISNDPITPHFIGQAAFTNGSLNQMLQLGNINLGQLESKFPRVTSMIGDPFQSTPTNTSKRKSVSSAHSTCCTKETLSKKFKSNESLTGKLSSFPLPSMKQARRVTMSFTSFQDVWDELETTPLQKEIFIRRLYKYDCKFVD